MIHRLAEFGVPLPSRIFRRSKNGSVVHNEGEHIRKVFFLSKTTISLFQVIVMQYIKIVS
jgi:hypothetical protein